MLILTQADVSEMRGVSTHRIYELLSLCRTHPGFVTLARLLKLHESLILGPRDPDRRGKREMMATTTTTTPPLTTFTFQTGNFEHSLGGRSKHQFGLLLFVTFYRASGIMCS
jgi:hypothetical protein